MKRILWRSLLSRPSGLFFLWFNMKDAEDIIIEFQKLIPKISTLPIHEKELIRQSIGKTFNLVDKDEFKKHMIRLFEERL